MALSSLTITSLKNIINLHKSSFSSICKPTNSRSSLPHVVVVSCISHLSVDKQQPSCSKKKSMVDVGMGILAASVMALTPMEADATRVEYYATVGEPLCELSVVRSGLGFCDVSVGPGKEAPYGELINVHYTARFADGTVFDSSYKRGRPLTMRVGVGKVIRGLDQGILGGEGVPPMHVGGKRKLQIPPKLAYGPEPAGCFSGDCNIPGNATLLYDINFVEIYSGNRKQ